jgi:hypothetical protein
LKGVALKKFLVLSALTLSITAAAQTAKPSAAAVSHTRARTSVPMAQPAPGKDAYALPVGTAIRIKLENKLSTSTSKRGDRFGGRVLEPVKVNGRIIIPMGTALEGEVVRAEETRRVRGLPTIDLRPQVLTLPDGVRYSINASVVDTSDPEHLDVNDEGEIKGEGHDRTDVIETAAGTGVGAAIGAKIGGVKGAFIGAGVGATATLVHWLTKTKSTDLPAGTELVLELNRPMQLTNAEGD